MKDPEEPLLRRALVVFDDALDAPFGAAVLIGGISAIN
jgi:hypothetical protein